MAHPHPDGERRGRVRCHSVHSRTTQDSRCHIQVELEWAAGTLVRGEGSGISTSQGILRAAAEATVQAIGNLADGRLDLSLRGMKMVRTFDAIVVIAALRGKSEERRYELIGSIAAPDEDLAQGAVLAVLDATNRILERYAPQP